MSKWTESFSDAVESAVRIQLSRFGFVTASDEPGYIVVQSEHCAVTFILEHVTVAILVRPLPKEAATESKAVYLNGVLNTLAPGKGFLALMKWLHGPEELREEVSRQVSLMVEHCEAILRGDFSDWPRIVAVNLHPERDQLPLMRTDRVRQLRDQAEDAFRNKHYLGVLQSYYVLQKELGEKLTPEELNRIQQAKDWLSGFGSNQEEL